jgi:dihydroflavonol-4-reductase
VGTGEPFVTAKELRSAVSKRTITTVLVTGGAGFLGSRIVKSYLETGFKVRVLDNLKQGSIQNLPPLGSRIEFLNVDLCDASQIVEAVAGHELVIHTAAIIRADGADERLLQRRVNIDGTRNIVEACRRSGVFRLIHISTTSAIGISPNPKIPADERFRFNLDHLGLSYNSTKQRAEELVLNANCPDLQTIVVNPGVLFGTHRGRYRGGQLIERVLKRPLVICTDGGISAVHVDDVVEGIRKVAESGRPGQRYILSGENVSFREIAHAACRVSNLRPAVISVPNVLRDLTGLVLNSIARTRGAGPRLYLHPRYAYQFYSSEKARTELGYQPRSFARIVKDYLDHKSDSHISLQ